MTNDIRPSNAGRHDYTKEIVSTNRTPELKTVQDSVQPEPKADKKNRSKPKSRRKYLKLAISLFVVIALATVGYLLLRPKTPPPVFPSQIANTVSYPIYYADNAGDGYTYKEGSASNRAGVIFYTLQNRKKNIIVSQQNAPTNPVNLKSLPKHSSLDIPIGQAVVGTGLGNPSIVITTPKTLIQITSNKGVTKDEIIHLAQKLVLLNQQPVPASD
ncbi:hypothetical protein KW803_03755 [Candidatus Saccharibacteria bacterium]|nr:hypothetical protein [Candidatus Saccharibacteria bacterium]